MSEPPTEPPDPKRVELVDQLLAALRERLLSADWFESEASTPVVQQGWESLPCGTRHPRYAWSNVTTYHFTIRKGRTMEEFW